MKYIVTINDKSYEVEVEKGQANIIKTTKAAIVPVQEAAPPQVVAPVVAPAPQTDIGSGEPIKSPLPGSVVSIKVQPGTAVKKGDILLVIEAMKMENEVTAPRDGVVTRIIVAAGAAVSTGDILLELQ